VLLSGGRGVAWLRRQPAATAALLDALQPGASPPHLLDADTEAALRCGAALLHARTLRLRLCNPYFCCAASYNLSRMPMVMV
jgi:hypothetical protein